MIYIQIMNNKKLHNFVRNLENILKDTEEYTIKAVKFDSEIIEQYNIQQLQNSTSSNGEILPEYSDRSKSEFGKSGRIKLKDTGEFYRGITAEVRKNQLQLISKSKKYLHRPAELGRRYGYQIIGLTNKNLQEFINEYLIKSVQNFVKTKLK